jgi:hypothetical protein
MRTKLLKNNSDWDFQDVLYSILLSNKRLYIVQGIFDNGFTNPLSVMQICSKLSRFNKLRCDAFLGEHTWPLKFQYASIEFIVRDGDLPH